jgi:hypothetical protein
MSCDQKELLVDALDEKSPAAAPLREHAATCAECSAELAALQGSFDLLATLPAPAVRPEVLARIAAAIAAEPVAPVAASRALWARALGLGAGGVALVRLATWYVGVRPDIRYLPMAERLAAPIVLSTLYVLGMGALFLGRRLWGGFLVAAAAAAVAVGATEPGFHITNVFTTSGCIPAGVAVGVAPLAVAFFLGRGKLDGGAVAGAVAGAASGLLAMAVLHLHCPVGNLSHGLVAHAGVTFVLAAMGALVGRQLFVERAAIA